MSRSSLDARIVTLGLALLALLAVGAFAVVAHGDEPGPKAAASAGTAKAGYIEQANAVCTAAVTDIRGYAKAPADPKNPYATAQRSLNRAAAAAIRLTKLQPPAPDAARLKSELTDKLVRQVQTARPVIARAEADVKAGRDPAAGLAKAQPPVYDLAYLRSYGLAACANFVGP